MISNHLMAVSVALARVIRTFGNSIPATREDIRNMYPALNKAEVHRFMEAGAPVWATTLEANASDYIGTDDDDCGRCHVIFLFDPLGCSVLEKNPAYCDSIENQGWREHISPDFNPELLGLD
jgi:hypothetical protein